MTQHEAGLLTIIGGTGVDLKSGDAVPGFTLSEARDEYIQTNWGKAYITRLQCEGREIVFLHRHANPDNPGQRHVPPHKINYRANIGALKKIGVTAIFASTAVGCLRREWPAGSLALLDQFIDFTTSRVKTFFDERAVHIDVTTPYCPALRSLLLQSAQELGITLHDGGTYLCADGPRFETPAEIRTFAQWGADVVGMTGIPEVTLAREAGIAYSGVSIITNAAAGISPHPLSHEEVLDAMKVSLPQVVRLFLTAARSYQDDPTLESRCATHGFKDAEFDPEAIFV